MTIVGELALILAKLPTPMARAEASHPVPIIAAGPKGTDDPVGYACMAVFGSILTMKSPS